MKKTVVKAAGVTTLTDARYFAARGVDWLGLSLDSSQDDHLNVAAALAIKEWVEGVRIIGEFGWANLEEIDYAIQTMALDAVQVGHFADEEALNKLSERCVLFREVVVEPGMTAAGLSSAIEEGATLVYATVVNLAKNGISWSDLLQGNAALTIDELKELCGQYALVLRIDIEPGDLEKCLHTLNPWGIEVRGGEEEKTGFKSFDELDDWLDTLENINS
jgi:phosphoribosylanthranilate isomerase